MRPLFILLAVLFLAVPSWGQETIPRMELELDAGTLRVYYAVSHYYLLKKQKPLPGGTAYEPTFGCIRLSYFRGILDENRFLYTPEKDFTFRFKSSDESVLHITNATRDTGFPYEPGTVIARKPGKAVVTVETDDSAVEIPITVVGLPIAKGDHALTVQAKLGKPDYIVDNPTGNGPYNGEHWYFDKYPELALQMQNGYRATDTTHPFSAVVRKGVPKGAYHNFHRDPERIGGERPYGSKILFYGSSTKKTKRFRITANRWKVNWKALPQARTFGHFTIHLFHASDNKKVQSIAQVKKPGRDSRFVYESGEFYLEINALSCEYEITVEEVPQDPRLARERNMASGASRFASSTFPP